MNEFQKLVNENHNKQVNERIAYHQAQVEAWTKNKERFGNALPECDIKIAYNLEMIEIEKATLV